jgi:hypothetical protein
MSYVQLLFLYLLLVVMWLGFTELWLQRGAIALWWILLTNSLKESIIQAFKELYEELMGTHVTTQLKNREKALTYYAARDFVHLSFEQKWKVGQQMGIVDHFDAIRDDESLEDFIFIQVVNGRLLDKFMATVKRIKHEDGI